LEKPCVGCPGDSHQYHGGPPTDATATNTSYRQAAAAATAVAVPGASLFLTCIFFIVFVRRHHHFSSSSSSIYQPNFLALLPAVATCPLLLAALLHVAVTALEPRGHG
jgi:hypothetical protein